MSFGLQKLRALIPGQSQNTKNLTSNACTTNKSFEPELGFQITLESNNVGEEQSEVAPELDVHLIAARHLPTLFGFKIVQGYLIKVKLFPGSKRLDSTIQTNSWPKFNEHFRFSLQPDIKPSLKHSSIARRSSKSLMELPPERVLDGQFVVFTVYALLELPPITFNRLSRTYNSFRDKSSNFVQRLIENKQNSKEETNESDRACKTNKSVVPTNPQTPSTPPALTYSESKRNIGSVTCYLESKIFKKNTRTGVYTTEELWFPIKDIISTSSGKTATNSIAGATKGVVEIVLEIQEYNESTEKSDITANTQPEQNALTNRRDSVKDSQWVRMTSEMKRKMGISNIGKQDQHSMIFKISTTRMRCSNKVKDELESTAGNVYVKTTIFENGIYLNSWKSDTFFPTLSKTWESTISTINVPIKNRAVLEHITIRTTLATKTKMNKKLVLGTVLLASNTCGSGLEHMYKIMQSTANECVAVWHNFQ